MATKQGLARLLPWCQPTLHHTWQTLQPQHLDQPKHSSPMRFADEHVARTRVEGELEDCTRRLAVAQEQVAEYAHERSTEAQQLLDRATQLHALIGQTNGQAAPHQLSQVCGLS